MAVPHTELDILLFIFLFTNPGEGGVLSIKFEYSIILECILLAAFHK